MAAPSKLEDPEIVETIIDCIENNLSIVLSAKYAGISAKSIQNWLKQGREDYEAGNDTKYSSFFLRFHQGEGNLAKAACDRIMDQLHDDPQSAWKILQRLDRKSYHPNALPEFKIEGNTIDEKVTCLLNLVGNGTLTTEDAAKLSSILFKADEVCRLDELSNQIVMLQERIASIGQPNHFYWTEKTQ